LLLLISNTLKRIRSEAELLGMFLIAAVQISGSYESESERLDVTDSSDKELRLAAEEPFSIDSPANGKALSSVPGSAVWVCIVVISCISEQNETPGSLGAGRYNFGVGQNQHPSEARMKSTQFKKLARGCGLFVRCGLHKKLMHASRRHRRPV
jgi:hypothetical protein